MKLKNNIIFIILGILVVFILLTLGYLIFFDSTTKNKNTNKDYITDQIGPTDIDCTTNIDCENICKDDGCLISSCVKSKNEETGKCACFNLCE